MLHRLSLEDKDSPKDRSSVCVNAQWLREADADIVEIIGECPAARQYPGVSLI